MPMSSVHPSSSSSASSPASSRTRITKAQLAPVPAPVPAPHPPAVEPDASESQGREASSYFNLHVDGVGYLNRVRTIRPKKGAEFLACTVAALRGNDSEVNYTKFDCRVSGADAQAVVRRLEADVNADRSVIVGFRISDIYPELFTFEKGERKGQPGVSIKGRLLRIKFAKVDGEHIDVPEPARADLAEVAEGEAPY